MKCEQAEETSEGKQRAHQGPATLHPALCYSPMLSKLPLSAACSPVCPQENKVRG